MIFSQICFPTIILFSLPFTIVGHDWEDPDDPTVIAENELMGAANSIDAAARKLMALRPRRVEKKVNSISVLFTLPHNYLLLIYSFPRHTFFLHLPHSKLSFKTSIINPQ